MPSWLVMLKKEDYYPNLARVLFKLAVKLHTELDIHIGFIDLSGGVWPWRMSQTRLSLIILAIGLGVRRAFEREVLVPAGMGDVAIHRAGTLAFVPLVRLLPAFCTKETYRHYLGVDVRVRQTLCVLQSTIITSLLWAKRCPSATHTYNVSETLRE